MIKYWNPRRVRRVRGREEKRGAQAARKARKERLAARREPPPDAVGKTAAIFEALGNPLRRRMLARLVRHGAMSLTKLSEPFGITLPAAEMHLYALERAALAESRKYGRVRICFYVPGSLDRFAAALSSKGRADTLAA